MNIKRRLANLERSRSVNRNQNRCQCGAPLLPFDDRLFNESSNEDAIDSLITHHAAPCWKCGGQSDVAAKIEFIYGDHARDDHENGLAE